MKVIGDLKFISKKSGVSKSGKSYFCLKCLDEEGENFATFFVDSDVYEMAANIEKGTEVQVKINITVGTAFVKLLEIVEI